jgi:hypothetical protein
MKNECAFVNSEAILKEWAQKTQIAASLQETNEKEELAAKEKKELEISEYHDIIGGSVRKLKTKKGVVADITHCQGNKSDSCLYLATTCGTPKRKQNQISESPRGRN